MIASDKLRVLIIDDERLARTRIRSMLREDAAIEIIGECENGREAVESIRAHRPDLVFLDVQMPGVDGFDVVHQLAPDELPLVVFVTAYDQYALKAFDVNAVDYLLKPFEKARFHESVARARKVLEHGSSNELTLRILQAIADIRPKPRRLSVRSNGRIAFVDANDVDWIEAAGNYLRLHVGKQTHTIRETMKTIESRLDANRFRRVHRSAIVNVDRVRELEPYVRGEYVVILQDGTRITTSGGYGRELRESLEGA